MLFYVCEDNVLIIELDTCTMIPGFQNMTFNRLQRYNYYETLCFPTWRLDLSWQAPIIPQSHICTWKMRTWMIWDKKANTNINFLRHVTQIFAPMLLQVYIDNLYKRSFSLSMFSCNIYHPSINCCVFESFIENSKADMRLRYMKMGFIFSTEA